MQHFYFIDFDQTLTKEHVRLEQIAGKEAESCLALLKPKAIEWLCSVLADPKNKVYITSFQMEPVIYRILSFALKERLQQCIVVGEEKTHLKDFLEKEPMLGKMLEKNYPFYKNSLYCALLKKSGVLDDEASAFQVYVLDDDIGIGHQAAEVGCRVPASFTVREENIFENLLKEPAIAWSQSSFQKEALKRHIQEKQESIEAEEKRREMILFDRFELPPLEELGRKRGKNKKRNN